MYVSLAGAVYPECYHISFDDLGFLSEDWVQKTGLKTVEDRKWELVDAKYGKGLYLGAVPLVFDDDNLSGLDLDLVTAIIFNVGVRQTKGAGYDEPFIWGTGKIHPASGAVAFWVKGSSQPEDQDVRTVLFELTTTTWGRKERELIEIELLRDGTISAYLEDARYVQHTIKTGKVWQENSWNHVVFNWDRSSGLSLWVNGREAATNMGTTAWWENQRPGLFHFGMSQAAYDEFYCFDSALDASEIKDLYMKNKTPEAEKDDVATDGKQAALLQQAFCTDTSQLPVIKPYADKALIFKEITPDRIHDDGIQGWYVSDGRYEMAWPHEYSMFTIIPGDEDFKAERVDILPPVSSRVNYITFEGNLDGIKVFRGDRDGHFEDSPAVTVPETDGFFYGTMVDGLGDSELRIPFVKEYGTPPGFKSDILKLPLTGDLRLHEVTLFDVSRDELPSVPGQMDLYLNTCTPELTDERYPRALSGLLASRDRQVLSLNTVPSRTNERTVDIAPMVRVNLMSDQIVSKIAYDTIILDLCVQSPAENNTLCVRVLDPAVPSHTWTHGEVRLDGFNQKPGRLRLALKFDPMFLVEGDRAWIQLFTTNGLTIIPETDNYRSVVSFQPAIDWDDAEPKYVRKTIWPNIIAYGRSFEYIPWEWDHDLPDVDAPSNFGGMFDMAYPYQAILKVDPGNKIGNIYKAISGELEYQRWGHPADITKIQNKTFIAPGNAPDWAVYFRDFQSYRNKIVTWWRNHQRSDGQMGGGWNDDTLVSGYDDLPLDSNNDALILYNNVFDGFDKTNYFKDGYCRIYPIDRMHNGDFVRMRYKSLIFNLGDPRSATWAMEEAWHWMKPDQTPVNYGNGKAFLYGKDVLEWYWGTRLYQEPYVLENKDEVVQDLRNAANAHNDITLWRYTDAWVHADDQIPFGRAALYDVLYGGWSIRSERDDSNLSITVGVGWIEGAGPNLGRLVEYSGNDGLKVQMYSFNEHEYTVDARLYRLKRGIYSIRLRTDADNDGSFETIYAESEKELKRFDLLSMTVPPKIPVLLDVSLVRELPDTGRLPDLAVSDYYVRKEGNAIAVTVHNIGCAASGPFTVTVHGQDGDVLASKEAGPLSDATDFVPKTTDVYFNNLPDSESYTIVIDEDDTVQEIYEENNTAIFVSQH